MMDLDEDWLALGIEPLPEDWKAPSKVNLRRRVEALGVTPPAYITVTAPNAVCRQIVYRQMGICSPLKVVVNAQPSSWQSRRISTDVASRIDLRHVLKTLIEVPSLLVDGPVFDVLDKDGFLMSAYEKMWSARYDYWEGSASNEVAKSLDKLIGDVEDVSLDEVLLWLTLGRQNGVFDRYVIPLDGVTAEDLSSRREEIIGVLTFINSWVRLESPLGLVFGVDAAEVRSMRETPLGRQLLQAAV